MNNTLDVLKQWEHATASLQRIGPSLISSLEQHDKILQNHENDIKMQYKTITNIATEEERIQKLKLEMDALILNVEKIKENQNEMNAMIKKERELIEKGQVEFQRILKHERELIEKSKEEFHNMLKEERESIQQSKTDLVVEQEQWKKFTSQVHTSSTSSSDIVSLRVGAKVFYTSVTTLAASNSMLSLIVKRKECVTDNNNNNNNNNTGISIATTKSDIAIQDTTICLDDKKNQETKTEIDYSMIPLFDENKIDIFIDRPALYFGDILAYFQSGIYHRFDYLLKSAYPCWESYDKSDGCDVYDVDWLSPEETDEWEALFVEIKFYQITNLLNRIEERRKLYHEWQVKKREDENYRNQKKVSYSINSVPHNHRSFIK